MAVETEMTKLYDVSFPTRIIASKPLSLVGECGVVEGEHRVVTSSVMGAYLDPPDAKTHLQNWKAKTGKDLAGYRDIFGALISAKMEKVVRVVVIKEVKGSPYGVLPELIVREYLVEDDTLNEEEDTEIKRIYKFFESKHFKPNSIITFHFLATDDICQIKTDIEGEKDELELENTNVVGTMQRLFMNRMVRVSPDFENCLPR